MEVWLIRHGETAWNAERRWQGHRDIPLNHEGVRQAERLAARLQGEAFDAVYASDLCRASDTARIALPNTHILTTPEIREADFGSWEGLRWDEVEAQSPDVLSQWLADPFGFHAPGGESFHTLMTRCNDWLTTLPRLDRIAVFTHGGPVRAMLHHVFGLPGERTFAFTIGNTSITRLRLAAECNWVLGINDISHLALTEKSS